jgi:hypothetical protein
VINYALVFAPGAICSTADDLIAWLKALHGGKVLSPDSCTDMTTPATMEDGTVLRYGLGIKIGENYSGLRFVGHGGTAPGFSADATWYPDAQMAVVVLMNTSPSSLSPRSIANAIANEVLPLRRPAVKYYTDDPTAFTGRYEHVAGGNQGPSLIEVTQTPDGLAFSVSGSPPDTLPWADGLTFFANENVTLTFRRANGFTGPVTELHADDAGNHRIFKKQ